MIAISDNDQKIIAFLIKNYASRFTTREIGLKLKISPAGSYKSLKKMEKGGIVVAEKLGTGLFYDINLRKTSAFHLACFVASTDEKDVKELSELTRLVLKHQNGILVVTGHHSLEQAKAAVAQALTPVLAQLEDLGNLVGIRVEGTDATSSTGLPIYDKYAQFFDFLIFTGIFVAIVYIGLSKFWGEDIKQGGAGRAVRALAIIVGAAMAIAVIRAGLSVSFFIPFAKNLLFFLVIIALYFLFQRMGIKSKFLSLILAVIVAVILFNVGSIFFTGKKLSLPSFGKETFKVPDFGGPTIVSSKVAEKISEATGGKAVKGDGLT